MSRFTPIRTVVPALLVACGLCAGQAFAMDNDPSTRDHNVKTLENVPGKVKEALLKESQGREIRDVDKETIDGRVVYQAKIQRDGKDLKLTVDEDGKVVARNDGAKDDDKVHDDKVHDDHGDHHELSVNDLPAKVKASLTAAAGAAQIVDIDRDTDNGRTVYKARIKQDGLDRHLTIGEDGTIVSDKNNKAEKDERGAKAGDHDGDGKARRDHDKDLDHQAKNAKDEAERDVDKAKADAEAKADKAKADAEYAKKTAKNEGRELKNGTVAIDQVPAAVKTTLMREANGQQIGDIDRDTEDGHVVYKAKIRVPDGKDRKVKVLEDGSIVSKKD
ncbi:MAG: PepSY-like domain-containing protein [Planctomycetes bacterium]|nr:PepSY-like domain-containing protein [Planctomycetota bacterium]